MWPFCYEILLFLLPFVAKGTGEECGPGASSTFSKWPGVRSDRRQPVFVYVARGDEPSLAGACISRCRELTQCAAVEVAHASGRCQGIARATTLLLRVDNDVSFYQKICMPLPLSCENRWWAVETTPGYHLHAEGRNIKAILNLTAQECAAGVLTTANDQMQYRSAQWVASSTGEKFDTELIESSEVDTGTCLLNLEDKYTEPESYRVANYRTLYIENQCRHDFPEKIERCSYEEYYNQSLKHVELSLVNVSKDNCKLACEKEVNFVCRGFTWTRGKLDGNGVCGLHSEDILTVGSWLLRRSQGSIYYRCVVCLNISVECAEDEMTVTYRPRATFRGRLYVPGRAEQCGASASQGGVVRLILPFHGPCDVNFAHALSNGSQGVVNRTMAYVMVMIQNNPIIQTAGDRWVRVGCSPGSHAAQLDATVTVRDDGIKPSLPSVSSGNGVTGLPASAIFNSSHISTSPSLTMYIVRAEVAAGDIAAGAPVSLGELLELRVETTDVNEIEAYHLVASSRLGDSSVLLLDSRGCQTGQVDFPAFSRSWHAGMQRLWARFKAFRFPTSHVVRFALMIRFCDGRCPLANCGIKSRSTRDTNETIFSTEENTAAAVRQESGWDSKVATPGVLAQSGAVTCGSATDNPDLVTLELELVVGSRDLLTADTLVRAEHREQEDERVIAAGSAMVCMHELLLIALVLAWLMVQTILLVGCCVVVKRYRNLAEMSMQKDYHSFDNIGFDTVSTHRRVHWPDQNVDILHAY